MGETQAEMVRALREELKTAAPCDCYEPGYGMRCDCGNVDDSAAMAQWLADQSTVARLDAILAADVIPWVAVGERMPHEEDADEREQVAWLRRGRIVYGTIRWNPEGATHWCRTADLPLPEGRDAPQITPCPS